MARVTRTPGHRRYEIAVVARKAGEKVGAYADEIAKLKTEERVLAHSVAAKLGHIPTRQGTAVECARCARSGSVGDSLTGAIHNEECK